MSEKLKKVLQIILYIALIFVIGSSEKYVRRLFRIPKTAETIESSDSELLGLLLDRFKFAKDWQWDLIITYQKNHSNNDSNVQEWASRQLVGHHDGHDVFLYHTLTIYLEPITKIDVEPFSSSVDQTPISIPQDSTFLPPVCYIGINNKQIQVTDCVLAREHKSIHEKIDVVVYGNADIKEIAELVRNLAMFLDGKEVTVR